MSKTTNKKSTRAQKRGWEAPDTDECTIVKLVRSTENGFIQKQSDWEQENDKEADFIKHKPVIPTSDVVIDKYGTVTNREIDELFWI